MLKVEKLLITRKNNQLIYGYPHMFVIKKESAGDDFKCEVNANLFSQIGSGSLSFSDNQLTITNDYSVFKLNAEIPDYDLECEEMPKTTFDFKVSELKEYVRKVAFAVSKRDYKAALCGVNFTDKAIIGCDGAKLSYLAISTTLKNITVPYKDLACLLNELNESKNYRAWTNEKRLFIVGENEYYELPLINADYPDVSKLINITPKTFLIVNRGELINALTSLNIIVNNCVKLENSTLSVSGDTGKAQIELHNTQKGKEDIKICFNANYMLEALKTLHNDAVELEFSGELKPIIIREDKHTILITPVRA